MVGLPDLCRDFRIGFHIRRIETVLSCLLSLISKPGKELLESLVRIFLILFESSNFVFQCFNPVKFTIQLITSFKFSLDLGSSLPDSFFHGFNRSGVNPLIYLCHEFLNVDIAGHFHTGKVVAIVDVNISHTGSAHCR